MNHYMTIHLFLFGATLRIRPRAVGGNDGVDASGSQFGNPGIFLPEPGPLGLGIAESPAVFLYDQGTSSIEKRFNF